MRNWIQMVVVIGCVTLALPPHQAMAQREQKQQKLAKQLRDILETQANAWNVGNIEKFMENYWKSEKLSFSSGGRTIRGWKQTLARYKQKYSTREKMGRLTFSKLEIWPLGSEAALVLGRWKVRRKNETLQGNFSLVFRKMQGQWVIVHDHTSASKTEQEES
ncbi:MAG: YybH family protein [Gemmataceae bacterium]